MKIEKNYDFRHFLNEVHRRDRRNDALRPQPGEMSIDDNWSITLDPACAEQVLDAARDLQDYLLVSMGVSVPIRHDAARGVAGTIHYTLEDAGKPRGFLFEAKGGSILISGHDAAGALQGGIYLEDLLNLREALFLSERSERREPIFSPRMVHSGWGLDDFRQALADELLEVGALLVAQAAAAAEPVGCR